MREALNQAATGYNKQPPRLTPVLGLVSAMAIVVGQVIGSGIFFKPNEVAQATGGFVGLILALWAACGLVNLCGALAQAELAAMFPQAGGTYVFLREAYGRVWSFLWAWAEFWVIRTGSIAAMAVYSAINFESILQAGPWKIEPQSLAALRPILAVGFIVALGGVNAAGVRWGAGVQNVMTLIKAGFVAFLALLPAFALGEPDFEVGPLWPRVDNMLVWQGIGGALVAIMWAYDGWGNVTVVAEEVRDPERTIPLALICGVLLVTVLYTAANLAYHLTLSSAAIAASPSPAVDVCAKLLPHGGRLMQAMLLVSLLGALNANILSGPRVLLALGRDYQGLGFLSRVSPRTHVPLLSTGLTCFWSSALILLGDLATSSEEPLASVLTSYCVFGGSIFYLAAVVAVFVLRRARPDVSRPYRTWGYPLTPAIFVAFYLLLLASTFFAKPFACSIGLGMIAGGLLPYALLVRARAGRG